MTDRIILKELVEKGSDADLLRKMIACITDRMMDMDVESLTGAAHGARSPDRTNHRNGYRQSTWGADASEWMGTIRPANEHNVLACMAFPMEHWQQLHSTTPPCPRATLVKGGTAGTCATRGAVANRLTQCSPYQPAEAQERCA
jgi:hypothetical protein